MHPEAKFFEFVGKWAAARGCRFEIQSCDQREADHTIDGMAPVDLWGWLLGPGETRDDKKSFGLLEWAEKDGRIELEWKLQ